MEWQLARVACRVSWPFASFPWNESAELWRDRRTIRLRRGSMLLSTEKKDQSTRFASKRDCSQQSREDRVLKWAKMLIKIRQQH
jgi:hypothetical protein